MGKEEPSADGDVTYIYQRSRNGERKGKRFVIDDCSEDLHCDYFCEIPRGKIDLPL